MIRHPLTFLAMVAAAALPGCEAPSAGPSQGQAAVVYVQRGQGYLKQELPESALAEFALVLEHNPRMLDAHLGMGAIYQKKGDYEKASASYEQAAAIAPGSFDAQFGLGLVRQLMGKVAEALRPYLQALAIDPNSFEANRNLASAYLQLNRAGEALSYARRATQLKRDDQAAWANLGAAYSLTGDDLNAVEAYREAMDWGEPLPPIVLGLAQAHIRLEHWDRAQASLQALIARQPSALAYERLGFVLFKQRRYEEALSAYQEGQKVDGKDVACLNGVGACLMTLYIQADRKNPAQRDKALDCWRKSLQINPDQSRIVDLMTRYQNL